MRHVVLKPIIHLPRQARDKHREKHSKKRATKKEGDHFLAGMHLADIHTLPLCETALTEAHRARLVKMAGVRRLYVHYYIIFMIMYIYEFIMKHCDYNQKWVKMAGARRF